MTDDTEAYQINFHEGHGVGHTDGELQQFTQSRAATDPRRPGFGEGYCAGYRLAVIERDRRTKRKRR